MVRVSRISKHAATGLQLAIFAVGGLSADDVLKFGNGQTVAGTYLVGDSREIRFAVGDAVRTFFTTDIVEIDFGTSSDSTQSQAAGLTEKQRHVCDVVGRFQRASLQYASDESTATLTDQGSESV